VTNTLAYGDTAIIAVVKEFYNASLWGQFYKHFLAVNYVRSRGMLPSALHAYMHAPVQSQQKLV